MNAVWQLFCFPYDLWNLLVIPFHTVPTVFRSNQVFFLLALYFCIFVALQQFPSMIPIHQITRILWLNCFHCGGFIFAVFAVFTCSFLFYFFLLQQIYKALEENIFFQVIDCQPQEAERFSSTWKIISTTELILLRQMDILVMAGRDLCCQSLVAGS